MNYYVAGGMYFQSNSGELNRLHQNGKMKFGLVHSSNELPYIWTDVKDIKGMSHHASIYRLSDDFTHVKLIKDNGTVPSPYFLRLTSALEKEVKLAIKKHII